LDNSISILNLFVVWYIVTCFLKFIIQTCIFLLFFCCRMKIHLWNPKSLIYLDML